MPEVRLTMVIQARNMVQAAFAQAAAAAGGFKVAVEGGAAAILKSAAAIGAIRGGLEGVTAITAAFSADWQRAVDSLERLPLGVGSLTKDLKDVLGYFTGINEQIAQLNDETREVDAETARARQRLLASQQLWGSPTSLQAKWAAAARLAGIRDEVERQKAELLGQRDSIIDQINALAAESRATSKTARVAAILDNVRQVFEEKAAALSRKHEADQKKAATDASERLTRLRAELAIRAAAMMARSRDEELKAELDQIREGYRQKIGEVRTGEERAILERLQVLDAAAADFAARRAAIAPALRGGVPTPALGRGEAGVLLGFQAGEAARVIREEQVIRQRQIEFVTAMGGGRPAERAHEPRPDVSRELRIAMGDTNVLLEGIKTVLERLAGWAGGSAGPGRSPIGWELGLD